MSKIFQTRVLTILTMVLGIFLLNSCQKEFTITATSNDATMGTVAGSGVYKKGTVVQLAAMPATGYQFAKWDDGNTDNPRSIIVEKNATYTAVFVIEKVDAYFSVSATNKVYFSPGNLQWSATNGGSTATTHAVAGNGIAAGTWRFAPNQWDTIGDGNHNISSTFTGWIDLFCWGTSGYDEKYPYKINGEGEDYGNGDNDITGTNYDWGVYNAIYNPTTNMEDAPGTWRTLTIEEWEYLLDTRTTSSNIRYAKATVVGVEGLIIVPDNWNKTTYPLQSTNTSDAYCVVNTINNSDWAKLEATGCIFLPAAGIAVGTSVSSVGLNGTYWSATSRNEYGAKYLNFEPLKLNTSNSRRYVGRSVRLVRDVQ